MKRQVDRYLPKYDNCIVLTNGSTEKIYLNLIKEQFQSVILDKYYGTQFYYLDETDQIKFDTPTGSLSYFDIGRMHANSLMLVEKAIELKNFLKANSFNSNIWCLFDKDQEDKGSDPFDSAIALAIENDINYAYSNRQFEVWFIMHYRRITQKMSAERLIKDINEHYYPKLKKEYNKGDEDYMLQAFLPNTKLAMATALDVYTYFEQAYKRRPKSEWASSTNFFKLLKDLGL